MGERERKNESDSAGTGHNERRLPVSIAECV